MSISLKANPDGSGTLLNGSTLVMKVLADGTVILPKIAAGSSANQPVNLGQFANSRSANGYQKLANGLILQWGVAMHGSADGTSINVTFPIPFPNACFTVNANSTSGAVIVGVMSFTTTTANFHAYNRVIGGIVGNTTLWFAIGH